MHEYIDGLTMSQAFYRTVQRFPNKTAQLYNPDLYYGDNDGQLSWKEVQERVEKIASGLLTLGLEKQQRVAIMAPTSIYWTHIDVATICSAACLVTIFPSLSLNEMSYIVNDSEARYLFVGDKDILDRVMPGFDKMPTLEKVIIMDTRYKSSDERVINLAELMDLGEKNMHKTKDEYNKRWQELTLDDWATILYTSGTTGEGKGVIMSHWTFTSRMDGTHHYFIEAGQPVTHEDVALSFLPLSHIFDRGCSQWMAIWKGATIAYADSPSTLMIDLQKYNPTWFSCVPRLYEKIYMEFQQQMEANPTQKKLFDWALKVGDEAVNYRMDQYGRYDMRPEFDLKSKLPIGLRIKYSLADKLFAKVRELFGTRFRFAFSASAGIAPDLLRFYYIMGVPVMEGYGSTETASACAYNPMRAAKPGTVGPEANGSKLRIAEDGELEVTGAGMFLGYLNKPEENEASFTEDGWFKTGDLVERDEQGYYRIVDRKKAIICLATGKNVAPAKIENYYATSTAIEQIFIIGDERTFISALIVPNFNYFIELFDNKGIKYDKSKLVFSETDGIKICEEVGEDFIQQPLLQDMIAKTVAENNKELESFEAIKQYTIIPRRFTEERDELTPTQKTKKRVILKNYKDVIDEIYTRKKGQ